MTMSGLGAEADEREWDVPKRRLLFGIRDESLLPQNVIRIG